MGKHTETPEFTGSVFLFLVSMGLVSAAIIIMFASASISSLDPGKGMQPTSGDVDRVEAKSVRSDFYSIDGSAAPIPADAKPPEPNADPLEAPSSPVSPIPADQPTREVGGALQSVEPLPSGDEELQPTPAAPRMPTSTTPSFSDQERDQTSREFETQYREQAQGRPSFPAPETRPNQTAQNAHAYIRLPRTNISLRELRFRKECGPIKDRELRRSCISSFNIDYPAR